MRSFFFFFQAEDGIRDKLVTGVQTCALPICTWRFGDKVYQCWAVRKGGHGYLTMREAIIQSCNVYFYHLGNDMGIERISKWAHLMGFGEPTGIDLPHEQAVLESDPERQNLPSPPARPSSA